MITKAKQERATIMVVEDDPTTEQSLIDCLSDLGNVVTFSNAENALSFVARGGRVDLVISDIVLGQMNGIELCERLSQQFSGDHLVPVIFYSAFADASMERLAYQAGGLDFLEKPMSFARMQLRVRSFLDISKRFNGLRTRMSLDALTGLMLRDALIERGSIALIKRLFSGTVTSLTLINVEGLAEVNAQKGYREGDRLLKLMAEQLQNLVSDYEGRELLLGRHMADRFVVLSPAATNKGAEADAQGLLQQLQERLDAAEDFTGQLKVYASCTAIVHDDALRVDRNGAVEVLHTMIHEAEKRLKAAKASDNRLAFEKISYDCD